MKYSVELRIFGRLYGGALKIEKADRAVIRAVRAEYKAILSRAGEIGSGNPLLSSYALAAFFIAMNRCAPGSPETHRDALAEGFRRRAGLLRMSLGSADTYFSEKRMEARRQWSERTHRHEYADDWVVDILGRTDEYEMGYDYLECGACKLCRREGCPDLARFLCSLDFLLIDLMGLRLRRTTTLAEGGDRCDFRFSKPE